MKKSTLILWATFLAMIFILGHSYAADTTDSAPSKDANAASDQTDNNFYWQGTQLYNLGRLGEAFDSFEKAIQRKQNSKESEAYLLQIRQEIVTNAKKRQDEKATLNYSGTSPESALNVSYIQKGMTKVILQAKYLFTENSATLRTGSVDVLNKLADLLENREGNRVDVTMVDEMDTVPNAKDIDGDRALLVFSYLNFRKLSTSQEPS